MSQAVSSTSFARPLYNYGDSEGREAWFKVVKFGNLEELGKELEVRKDVLNLQDKGGLTALHHVIELNNLEKAQLLIERKATVDLTDKLGNTALKKAVCHRRLKIAECLIGAKADVNLADEEKRTPLMRAGDLAMARLLVENGANINAASLDSMEPLMYAVQSYDMNTFEVVRYLLDQGADPHKVNNEKQTLLMLASEKFHIILKAYWESDDSANTKISKELQTVLDNFVKMLELLISYKVDAKAVDSNGKTVLHYFEQEAYPGVPEEITKFVEDVQMRLQTAISRQDEDALMSGGSSSAAAAVGPALPSLGVGEASLSAEKKQGNARPSDKDAQS